jgi:ubiquinone/menaquinone biosynthesis C-methylase UbiE
VSALANANARDQRVVAERRNAKKGQELRETYVADPKRYPDYYLQNFHYQTDGWLSAQSARLYDFQVEMLFLGSADAMRRRALPYIADFMRNRDASTTKHLDVASGTGRFLSFVRDNHPELQSTALELSPHYLEATRKLNKRFEGKGGSLRLVEANAEDMPLEDNEFDMITNVYLFHELPRAVRVTVAKEMARVLKPGGKLFFVDSVQIGDGKENGMEGVFELAIDRFPAFNHEPYYKDYAVTNLVELFEDAGLRHEATATAWVSKTMVFSKPFDGQDLPRAAELPVEVPQEMDSPVAAVEAITEEKPSATETVSEDEPEIGTRKF